MTAYEFAILFPLAVIWAVLLLLFFHSYWSARSENGMIDLHPDKSRYSTDHEPCIHGHHYDHGGEADR